MLTSIPWYVFLKCSVWLRIKILLNLLLASTTAIQLAAWSGLPSLFLMQSLSVLKAVPRKHPGNDGFHVSNSNTSCVIFKCINREIYYYHTYFIYVRKADASLKMCFASFGCLGFIARNSMQNAVFSFIRWGKASLPTLNLKVMFIYNWKPIIARYPT